MDITDQDIKEILDEDDELESSDHARREIIKLWSQETPLYSAVNRANQFQDQRAIKTLGPYAKLLFQTLWSTPKSNRYKKKKVAGGDGGHTILYRGLGLPEEAIKVYSKYQSSYESDPSENNEDNYTIYFTGFTATSLDKK